MMAKAATSAKVNDSTYLFIHALHPGTDSFLTLVNVYHSNPENSPGVITVLLQLAKNLVLSMLHLKIPENSRILAPISLLSVFSYFSACSWANTVIYLK